MLVERNTYTPTNTPHVRGNCGPGLKDPRGRVGVQDLKTSSNRPDEALTPVSAGGPNPRVSVMVLNLRGQPLMPTTPRKARVLLEQGKARVTKRTPFVIQLTTPTGETTQPIVLGVDTGYAHVGLSATTEKREVFSAEVQLRSDMVDLNSERRMYRRTRRNRKTRYRQPRFLNRGNKQKGWLAPSIQHKFDSHVRLVERLKRCLPITKVVVEVGAFDIQKIRNPEIEGTQYQEGVQKDFDNVREYVLYRDGHVCQHCKGKSKDKVLNVHHLESRKTGGDRPENLLALCLTCHEQYHRGIVKLKAKPSRGFRAETFMSIVWKRLTETLDCSGTYGYETKGKRRTLGLPKSHGNDAFVISGGTEQERSRAYEIRQVRKQNRKLFKGPHSAVRNTAPRFVHGYQRYDKVRYRGQECFVFGRRTRGTFDIRTLTGTRIHTDAHYKTLRLRESASTWLTTVMGAALPPQG